MKDGFRFVDVDMHIKEPYDLFDKYLEPAFKTRVTSGIDLKRYNAFHWLIDGKPLRNDNDLLQYERAVAWNVNKNQHVAFAQKRGYDAESMLMGMEMEGVDIAVLYPTIGLYFIARDDIDPQLAAAICRAYNDWINDYCAYSPDQLKWVALLPTPDVNLAAHELERCVKRGSVGAMLRPNYQNGRYWHSAYWDHLYSMCEELNVPLCFHEGTSAHYSQIEPRFGPNRFLRHVASHTTEMQLSAIAFILGGVLEMHPKLRVAFLEAQSWWVPGLLERMEIDFKYHQGDAPYLKLSPKEYWKRNCYSAIESAEKTLKAYVDYFGDCENLAVSTDFPHFDSNFPEVSNLVLGNPGLTKPQGGQILSGGGRLYGFGEEHFKRADAAAAKRRQSR